MDHINRALPTEGHTPMYVMHKYFARKQQDVISEYIKHYSKEGDIVLDPFCGSGVMIGEALKLGRKAIGVDINPVSIFITRNTIKHVDGDKIIEEFKNIENDISQDINSLYITTCRECEKLGKKTRLPATCFTWKGKSLVDVRYECKHHEKSKIISPVNEDDLKLHNDVLNGKMDAFFDKSGACKYWYPTNRFYYRDGTPFLKKERFESVDQLFTKRNLVALAKLRDRIEKITDDESRESFKFAFSALTHLASSMTPVRPSRPFSSAWVQQSYWKAPHFMESNVWYLFKRGVMERQGLLNAKRDIPDDFASKKEAKDLDQLMSSPSHHYLLELSANAALKGLKDNSIDYVITDPPYGHSIQYGELLFMWGCWLKLMDNFDELARGEIVVNPRQRKDKDDYEKGLRQAFQEIYRVLKPGKYCTVTFHNPALVYRNMLFKSAVLAGFTFEKVIYQPPPRPSAKSLLQPFGSLEGDYFFRFKKSEAKGEQKFELADEKRVESLIVGIAERIIVERGEPTNYTFIQNSIDPILYEELSKRGMLISFNPTSVLDILKKHVGETFRLVNGNGKDRRQQLLASGWWLADPNKYKIEIPLVKRVDDAIVNLLREKGSATLAEVLTDVYTRFQDALTPEYRAILEILKKRAIRSGDRWSLKPE
ncbi:MAG: DNA methyltransferase [Candidatus Sigynarchaeota archaeon]